MTSMYFDDSLTENKLHYSIKEYLDEHPLEDDWEEIVIKCKDEEEYNNILDDLFRYNDGKINIYSNSSDDTEIIIALDPRLNYRQFDEKHLIDIEED